MNLEMTKPLEQLLLAADQHGEDSEPDHTIGDLRDLLSRSWAIMSASQRIELLRSTEAYNVIESGARGEFEWDTLVNEIKESLAQMEEVAAKAGYAFFEGEMGYFWETEEEASEVFNARDDAVESAYRHFTAGAV